jgi:hypothetical protein
MGVKIFGMIIRSYSFQAHQQHSHSRWPFSQAAVSLAHSGAGRVVVSVPRLVSGALRRVVGAPRLVIATN